MSERPNILWICTDQQRYDTIGALGNPHVRTPNLDSLVKSGVAFTHAFCQSPICTPSRASFLTGQYPCSIRACTNGNERWADAAPLITKRLADSGYDCGLSGKLHLSAAAGRIEQRPDDGYRVFHWSHHPTDHWPEGHDYVDWLNAQGIKTDGLDLQTLSPELHQTSWCADRAIDFIREHAADGKRSGEPWLFSVNPFDPHSPFNPPYEIVETYDVGSMPNPLFQESDLTSQAMLESIDFQSKAQRPKDFDCKQIIAAYYAMIELIDRNVGRMLDALRETGQLENTIVIFMSDHGESLGDHGLLKKGCRFYEGLVRVPLIISCPGTVQADVQSDALVELRDIVPTILQLAGIEMPDPPRGMSSQSLLPILTGAQPADIHRDAVRCEYYHTLSPLSGFNGSYATMLRNNRYKLVVYHELSHGELFDLQDDPGEFENLWNSTAHTQIRFDMLKQMMDDLAHAIDVGTKQVATY